MISFHLSTLYRLKSINKLGISYDIQHFVQKRKTSLDDVITQIRQKLCKGIKHIEDVLDNATRGISEKLLSVMIRIYHEFLGQNGSKVRDLLSLPNTMDYIPGRSIYEALEGLELIYERDVKGIENDIKYLIDKLPIAANRIFHIFGGRRRGPLFIMPGKRFTMRESKALVRLQKQEVVKDVTNLIGGLEFMKRHSRKKSNSMNRIIQEMEYLGYDYKKGKTFQYHIQRLKTIRSYYEGLEGRVRTMMESWDVLKKILDADGIRGGIRKILLPELESLIGVIERIQGQKGIGSRANRIKDSIGVAIKRLERNNRYVSLLIQLKTLVERLINMGIDFRTREIEKMIENGQMIEEILSPIKKYFDQNVENIRTIFRSLENGKNAETGILGSIMTTIENRLNIDIKSYIRKLRAIQTIQGHLEKIKEKKDELSPSKSDISGIISVESGITQFKKIQRIIETFSYIATDIESLESTYHFELRTSLDIGGEVKGLMSTISDTLKLKSHIDSYIKFLEEIKTSSKVLEIMESEVSGLPSIGDISYRLGLKIWQIIDDLGKIKTNISEMNTVITTIINISTILIMMYFKLP